MAKNLKSFLGQYSSVQVNTDIKENQTCEIIWSFLNREGVAGIGTPNCTAAHNAIFGGAGSPRFYRWNWIVPNGVSNATFHLWGGGGGGAPAYCCMSGVSGGSGAYVYKTIPVTPGTCYTACYEGADRYCCSYHLSQASGSQTEGNSCPWIMYGLRGMSGYVTGPGLTNFCAEGGNPGVTRCGYSWGQDQQNDSPVQHPGNCCCQLWKICHIVKRRTIDSDNDRYAVAKYYGGDGGSKGMYACHRMSCCQGNDQNANRCGDRYIVPFPGGLTPNKYAPYGDMELQSIHGGHAHLKNCQIIASVHAGYMVHQINEYLGYICNDYGGATVGVGGISAVSCGGTCCCGAPGGVPHLRIEYS